MADKKPRSEDDFQAAAVCIVNRWFQRVDGHSIAAKFNNDTAAGALDGR